MNKIDKKQLHDSKVFEKAKDDYIQLILDVFKEEGDNSY